MTGLLTSALTILRMPGVLLARWWTSFALRNAARSTLHNAYLA
jgi:hypothetical protein